MHEEDRHQHFNRNGEGSQASQESYDETQAAEEFRQDRQQSKESWNSQSLSELVHGPVESGAAEPAENLLRAMRKEDHAQDQPNQCQGVVIRCLNELAE